MVEFLTPEIVLEQFGSMRSTVLQVIAQGERLAEQLPAMRELGKRFKKAADLVSGARLSLVVLGGEGAGKSTLIRGILGAELSPIEADEAGTVAPVFITYGNSAEPTFEVRFLNHRPSEICSQERYYDYIRQSKNPDNKEDVECAFVRVNNSLLAHGLVLVDMPGTGGCSDVVREQARDFIRDETTAVIGVASVRTYGPLIDIARIFVGGDDKLKFQAIVSNRWTDTFLKRGSLEPLPEATVAANIEDARRKGYEQLAKRMRELGLEDTLTEDLLFVFSADVLYDRKGPIATAPHMREIERFLDRISRYVQENGLGMAIQEAAREGEDVLGILSRHVNLRRDILQRVLAGDRGLLRLFKENRVAAMSTLWVDKAYGEARLARLKDEACNEFSAKVADYRRHTIRSIDGLISDLQNLPKGTASINIRDKVARARSDNADQVTSLNGELADLLMRVRDTLLADANKAIARALEGLPLFESHGGVSMTLTREDVVRTAISGVDDGTGRLFAKSVGGLLGAAGGYTLAGKAATVMLLTPDPTGITQTIGLVLGGAAAFSAVGLAITRFFGSETEAAIKELGKMRDGILDQKTRDGLTQELRQHVVASVDHIGKSVHTALVQRLMEIETLIESPSSEESARIEGELAALESMRGSVSGLENRLLAVRSEAQKLARAAAQSGAGGTAT